MGFFLLGLYGDEVRLIATELFPTRHEALAELTRLSTLPDGVAAQEVFVVDLEAGATPVLIVHSATSASSKFAEEDLETESAAVWEAPVTGTEEPVEPLPSASILGQETDAPEPADIGPPESLGLEPTPEVTSPPEEMPTIPEAGPIAEPPSSSDVPPEPIAEPEPLPEPPEPPAKPELLEETLPEPTDEAERAPDSWPWDLPEAEPEIEPEPESSPPPPPPPVAESDAPMPESDTPIPEPEKPIPEPDLDDLPTLEDAPSADELEGIASTIGDTTAKPDKAYEAGTLDLDGLTCDDCVYVNTCPKRGESDPASCGSFQWKSI